MDLSKIDLDPIFNSRIRLSIISILSNNEGCLFTDIVKLTNASAGNVSAQIKKLEEAGYIEIHKGYRNNYSSTVCYITIAGVAAFDKYKEDIARLIDFGSLISYASA